MDRHRGVSPDFSCNNAFRLVIFLLHASGALAGGFSHLELFGEIMIFIFGKRLLGKCDDVPGFFHVATQFFHIDYIPLIPIQSWVVISKNGSQFRGFKIPMSGKSILCAWGRIGTLVAAIVLGVITAVSAGSAKAPMRDWLPAAVGAVLLATAFGFLTWHRSCTKASFNRATQLAQIVGLTANGHAQLQQLYGEGTGRGFDVVPMGNFHEAAGFESGSNARG